MSGTQIVTGYRSTTLAPTGYAYLMSSLIPNRWFDESDLAPGGVLWAILYGFGTGFDALDQGQIQSVLSMLRLRTSVDGDVDSWAQDFLGTLLQRFTGELDPAYIARIEAWLQAPKCTIAAITAAVNAYLGILQYLSTQSAMGADTFGALDTLGSLDQPVQTAGAQSEAGIAADTQGALDTQGGFDVSSPGSNPANIVVFDLQSNPTLAASVGLTAGQFCIYFQYPGYSDNLIHVINPYSSVLQQFVNAVKSEGTAAVYASNKQT